MGRSILGIFGGYFLAFALLVCLAKLVVMVVPSLTAEDGNLIMTNAAMAILAICFAISATAGCYLAAFLNMGRPKLHALITAVLLAGSNIILALMVKDETAAWKFHFLLAVVSIPCALLATRLFLYRHPKS